MLGFGDFLDRDKVELLLIEMPWGWSYPHQSSFIKKCISTSQSAKVKICGIKIVTSLASVITLATRKQAAYTSQSGHKMPYLQGFLIYSSLIRIHKPIFWIHMTLSIIAINNFVFRIVCSK
jgi:hypothetical protein